MQKNVCKTLVYATAVDEQFAKARHVKLHFLQRLFTQQGLFRCSFCKSSQLSTGENNWFSNWMLMNRSAHQLRECARFTGIWTSYTDQYHEKHGVFLRTCSNCITHDLILTLDLWCSTRTRTCATICCNKTRLVTHGCARIDNKNMSCQIAFFHTVRIHATTACEHIVKPCPAERAFSQSPAGRAFV